MSSLESTPPTATACLAAVLAECGQTGFDNRILYPLPKIALLPLLLILLGVGEPAFVLTGAVTAFLQSDERRSITHHATDDLESGCADPPGSQAAAEA